MKRWRGWGERRVNKTSPEFKGHGERHKLRGGGHWHSLGGRGTHDSGRAVAAGGEVGVGGIIGVERLELFHLATSLIGLLWKNLS